ncbi:conserved Plasmodium protein, unknown function [Plasmodium relictum]|uniref:CS domain-containing protein n=1 Tax=Plasmodium relictum TaxID=85471 RepID=A0A1J1HA81_PLARL|nr:conserved Plasmodium protein, unknown function [Plasmodium relictum]CRH01534.1 conserved Plasmodium protein, unknown function [Plasmodium relictum]
MNLDWKENFEEIEITIRKKKNNEKELVNFFHNDFFLENYYPSKLDNVKDVLITEVYIRVVDKNNILSIDLYDKISINKDDIRIKKNEDFLILKLKKKEKKLWGYLHFFSLFIRYKNKFYPNLLKCTKEEKDKIFFMEKRFKSLINVRRMKSLEHLKKILKKEKTHNEEFCRKLEDNAQKMQMESEELKNKQLKILKEDAKKKAINSIYEEYQNYDINEVDQSIDTNGVCNNNQVHEMNKDKNDIDNKGILIEYNNKKKKKNMLLCKENIKNRVIELKFTELKRNEIPARETRNLKKTLSNYSSTKNFFLIILIEKAKKFFKNSDFSSCLETLNSITSFVSTGNELNREELIKVLNNLSLLYLLTNNLDKCVEECDKCLNIINEEIKNYNVEETDIENTSNDNKFLKTLNSLEEIKTKNYIQYLYIIYAIVTVRKMYAITKKNDLKNIEDNFLCIKNVQKFLPRCFYESIKKDMDNLKVFNILVPILEYHHSSSKEIKEDLYKLNNQNSNIKYDFFLNFYFVLKRSFYLKNLNFFYKNIINILLCFFHIIDKQNKIYSFLNNIEQFSLTKFLLNIYEFILLLKNNSSFIEKVIEIEKLNDILENSFIQEEIINVLNSNLRQDDDNELEFLLKNNCALKKIIYLLRHSNNDEDRYELEKEKEEKKKNEKKNISEINLSFSDIFYDTLYKLKKNNKIVRDISSNFSKNELRIELFTNKDYYKSMKDSSELLKIELSLKIIKFMCYSFNLIQKIYKDNMKEKKFIRDAIFNLLIDLSYCISNLNSSYLKIENIVSVIFLYFCFYFIYNFKNNEFFIDTQLKSDSKIHFHMLALNDIETNKKITKDTIKNMITKTFLNNFYAEYKNYIDFKKNKEEYTKNSEYNVMLNKTCYLIKKLKNNNKNLEILLINNKYVEEIFNFLICLNKQNYYLKSIQYSVLLLSHDIKYPNISMFNLNYIYLIKTIFNMSFFVKNKMYKDQTIKKNITILNQEKLKKILSHFTDSSSIKFKNTKRVIFTKSLENENVENNLVNYLETIIKKFKKIKIFRNINFCLKKLDASKNIITNIQNIVMKYMDNLLIDFHILNCILQFNKMDLSSYFFINKNIIVEFNDLNSKVISLNCQKVFNKLEYKNIVKYYFKKFLKTKIIILNNIYYL